MLGGKEQPLFRLDAEAVPKGQQGHCGVAVVLAHPHRCIGRVGSQRSGDRDIVYKVNERARIVEPQPTAAHAGLSDEELVTGIGEALATVRKQMRDEISKLREDHERLRAQIEAANVVSIGRGRSDPA